jgi:hypothetical protein
MLKPKVTFLYADSRNAAYKCFDDYDVLFVRCQTNGVEGDCTTKEQVGAFFNQYEDGLEEDDE